MAKYIRTTKRDLIDSNKKLNAAGCNTYTLYNIGNTRVMVDGILPLLPGEQYEGANENPDIFDYSDIDLIFDQFPYAGFTNATANKDTRLIITRSYVVRGNDSDVRIPNQTTT